MARPTRTMLIAGAAVVVAALVGGGATYLATTSTSQSATAEAGPTHHGQAKGPKSRKGGKAERAADAGVLGKIEHGEFTTVSSGVMQIQRGAITAIDPGSVTVRSADGFTASYTITPTTAVGKGGKGRKVSAQPPAAVAPVPGAPTPNAPAPGVVPAPGDAASGVGQLKAGDTVQVMATKTDAGSNATRIAPART